MGRRQQGSNRPPLWHQLSDEERLLFSQNGEIDIKDWYLNNSPNGGVTSNTPFYEKSVIDSMIAKVLRRETKAYGSYEQTTKMLYQCLEKYPIKGKKVAIMGSVTPWHESVCLAYEGIPTTIEYNKLSTDDERLRLLTVDEYNKKPEKFDIVFSISSYEHDGLGRYGDPIDPDGDIKAMSKVKNQILKKGGLLFLAVPTGRDALWWNAHRIYGPKRWHKLIQGFTFLYCTDDNFSEILNKEYEGKKYYQPVVVLRNDE